MTPPVPRVWRLRSHLAALLVVAMVLSFALVLAGLLAWRLPRIEQESRRAQMHEVGEMRNRMERLLRDYGSRLAMLHELVDSEPAESADAVLDSGVGDSTMLRAIYCVSAQGRITAVGLPPALRPQRADLLGNDMTSNHLVRAVQVGPGEAWSALYPSVLSGEPSLALAVRSARGDVLVGEMPLESLMRVVQSVAGRRSSAIWVVDRRGELVADSRHDEDIGRLNIWNWPLMQALLLGETPAPRLQFRGDWFATAVSHSTMLDWFFIGRVPVGWANPLVRDAVLDAVLVLAGGLLIGLALAPFWASRMARPLGRIIERADRSASGGDEGLPWPRSSVAELNRLSDDLQGITAVLHERERQSQAVFHASPVPMSVTHADTSQALMDVNEAWCREFGFRREDVLGRSAQEIGLADAGAVAAIRKGMGPDGFCGELWLRRGDGTPLHIQVHARLAHLPSAQVLILAALDIGPMRRAEEELRALNLQLEDRVRARTEALAGAHAELSQTVAQLRSAQDELVRAEKMAVLGSLVAGVAHELNTPLGNGVMAVSAMAEATRSFQAAMQGGPKRADLLELVQSIEQGTDIAGRNLRRAAELVQHFKQVAVDQTSDQRRRFELAEVVEEMVVSLRPSLAHQPWQIEVQVPSTGLVLDSYPGALGQVLGNLIQNAVLHGFDGRDHGRVHITGGQGEPGWLWLQVADDGHGIAAAHIGRIFDPFMTTRPGRGGTGLGLHISHNAVANLLGGTLHVHSLQGRGTRFEIRLPAQAPQARSGAGAAWP